MRKYKGFAPAIGAITGLIVAIGIVFKILRLVFF